MEGVSGLRAHHGPINKGSFTAIRLANRLFVPFAAKDNWLVKQTQGLIVESTIWMSNGLKVYAWFVNSTESLVDVLFKVILESTQSRAL